jgi:hypothetical protein
VAVRVPPADQLAPWVALVVWAGVLWRLRRGRPWLRSTALALGLVIATAFADASVVVASERISEPGGRSLATWLLWVATLLSVTTFLVLRAPDDDGDGGGGSGPDDEEPEPPWWPEFERAFRDYARRSPRRRGSGRRPPAGVP